LKNITFLYFFKFSLSFCKEIGEFWGTSLRKCSENLFAIMVGALEFPIFVRLRIFIAQFGFKRLPILFGVFSC